MKATLLTLGIGTALYALVLFVLPNKQTTANYLFNVVYSCIFLTGAWIALRRAKIFDLAPYLQLSMRCFAAGMTAFASGLLVWTFYNLVLKIGIPYPSLADLFFLLYYPFTVLGVYFMIRSFGNQMTSKLRLEGALILFIFFAILYAFLNQTSLGETVPMLAKIFNLVYPFADSFLIVGALTLLRTEKGIISHPNILYLVFAFLVLAAADTTFSFRSANGLYWNGDVSDILFALSGFLGAWGVLSFRNINLTYKVYK